MRHKLLVVLAVLSLIAGLAGCNRSPAERGREALERGSKHFRAKDYSRAIIDFRNAIQAEPRNAEAHYQLGLALAEAGDVNMACAMLRRAVELNPGHTRAQVRLAELVASTGDPALLKDVVDRMRGLLSSAPDDSGALAVLGYAEIQLGALTAGEEHLAQAVESGPTNIRAAAELARMRLASGKRSEAEAILLRLIEQNRTTAMPYLLLGQFYAAIGRAADAEREVRKAVDREPGNVVALLYLGALCDRAGEAADAEAMYRRAAQAPDQSYRSVHAVYLLQKGRRDEAISELERLFARDSADRLTRRYLVAAYLSAGRRADAERVLTAALKTNRRDVDALLQRSGLWVAAHRITDAESALGEVLKFEPDSAEAHYLLSRVHAARGNVNRQKFELSETVRLNPELLIARVEYARVLTVSGAAKLAMQTLEEAPAFQKKMPAFIAERNWALAATGRPQEMQKDLDEALAVSPSADLLLQSAIVKLTSGNTAAARSLLRRVLGQYPEEMRGLDLLGQTYVAEGKPAAAIDEIRAHAASHPASGRVRLHLGTWLRRTGAVAEARAAFEAAKSAEPSLWSADIALAGLDLAENKSSAAKDRLQPLLNLAEAEWQARLLLASAEIRDGNTREGIEHYRKVLRNEPDNVVALNNLACALAENANAPDEALKFAERAKELSPDDPTVDDTLGWILYRKGLYSRAAQYLESSVKKQPNPVRHAHLAMLYAAQGDTRRGIAQLSAAVRTGGESLPDVRAAQRALAAVR